MTYFLTSSPFGVGSPYLNPANRFIDLLREAVVSPCAAVFVCADPDRRAFTAPIALAMKKALLAAGAKVTLTTSDDRSTPLMERTRIAAAGRSGNRENMTSCLSRSWSVRRTNRMETI